MRTSSVSHAWRASSRRRSELAQRRKTTHWIWFIFPQMLGLGKSARSQKYRIRSREEALAYLEHPILGPRLLECTLLVSRYKDAVIGDILPHPDDLQFHSSMTLFQASRSSPTRSIDFSGAQLTKRRWRCFAVSRRRIARKKTRRWAEPKAARFRFDRKRMIDFKKFT